MVLLTLVSLIDLDVIPVEKLLPAMIKLKVEFSQSILIALSAAFLTITTFTFSTILTVLNTYASSFTPRVVENFINMKITLKVIGIFIGGFFYCVGSLIFTRGVFNNETVISGSIAIIYSIVCIIYFIVFVQGVITKFQGVNIILDVANISQSVIDGEVELRQKSIHFGEKENLESIEVISETAGYLSAIDVNALISLMTGQEGYLKIDVKLGEYIPQNTLIATLFTKDKMEEQVQEKILKNFILQDKKIETIDYRYNMEKLLEIALRAISSGINDPNTAIHCINKLGDLLTSFAGTDNYHIQKAGSDKFRIYYSSYSFKEDLDTFYLPLINYGKEDLQVVTTILQSLSVLFNEATYNNKKHIINIIDHIKEKVDSSIETSLEREIFNEYLRAFDKKSCNSIATGEDV